MTDFSEIVAATLRMATTSALLAEISRRLEAVEPPAVPRPKAAPRSRRARGSNGRAAPAKRAGGGRGRPLLFEHAGEQATAKEWAAKLGVSVATIKRRARDGVALDAPFTRAAAPKAAPRAKRARGRNRRAARVTAKPAEASPKRAGQGAGRGRPQLIEHAGETATIDEWARKLKLSVATVRRRVATGQLLDARLGSGGRRAEQPAPAAQEKKATASVARPVAPKPQHAAAPAAVLATPLPAGNGLEAASTEARMRGR